MNIDDYLDWIDEHHGGMASLATMEEFMSIKIGDELWTTKIDRIRYESPLFDTPTLSWWQQLLVWLRVEPAPVPLAVLPTVTVELDDSAGVDALEKMRATLADALATIEAMESDSA